MTSAHLDMTLAGQDAKSGLGAEVDELAPEVTLVLRHILVERRGQSRVVPGRRLCVVVDKVDAGRVGETHFPPAGQGTELRHGLLLDRRVGRILAVHAYILLPSGVDPCRRARVVVDKVRAPFRCVALLPSGWKLARAGRRGTGGHHGDGAGGILAIRWRTRGGRKSGRVCAGAVVGQHSVLMADTLSRRLAICGCASCSRAGAVRRPDPCCLARVVIDVVCSAKVVFSPLPSTGQSPLRVLKRREAVCSCCGTSCAGRARKAVARRWSGRGAWWRLHVDLRRTCRRRGAIGLRYRRRRALSCWHRRVGRRSLEIGR